MTRQNHLTHLMARPRGTTIFTALVMIGIMSVAIVSMLQYSLHQNRMTQRRVEREAVYYVAEAGVDQVIHYFNFPQEYASNTAFFTKDAGTGFYYSDHDSDGFGETNVFAVRMPTGTRTLIDSSTSPNPLVFGLEAGDGENRAQVTDLHISLPTANDLAAFSDAVMIVHSEAQNEVGQTRTLRATLTATPPFSLQIPAAIISLDDGGSDGQGNVRWGEAWFKTDFQLPNGGLNNVTTALVDPWVNFRTEQNVLMGNGDYADGYGGSTTPLDPTAPNYFQPWGDDGTGGVIDPDHINIHQHAAPGSIPFPDPLDYDLWKSIAQARGLYFSWNEEGNSLVVGQSGEEISPGQFLEMVNQIPEVITGVDGESQSLPPEMIVFVDTLDGNPPNGIPAGEAGSNLCDLRLGSGNRAFFRGLVYVGGDVRLNIRGVNDIWIQDPDMIADPTTGTEVQVDDLFMSGLFYCEGEMDTGGNPAVYGSLFARGGFGTNGNPEVWYDARLNEGLPFSFNSNIAVARVIELDPNISGPLGS